MTQPTTLDQYLIARSGYSEHISAQLQGKEARIYLDYKGRGCFVVVADDVYDVVYSQRIRKGNSVAALTADESAIIARAYAAGHYARWRFRGGTPTPICMSCLEHDATCAAYDNASAERDGDAPRPCCDLCAPWSPERRLPLATVS